MGIATGILLKKELNGMLVKFIAVDNKKQIDDNYAYIDDIYKVIRAGGLIKNLNIDPDAAAFGVGAVREVDDDGNVFVLEFNSADGEKSNIWSVYFAYGTYNNSKQLEISIYSDTYVPKVDEGYLEKLKIRIKKSISKDWERIIWLVDKDSECLSICLYPQIYKVENLMREVINEVMTKQYGISWWDSYVPANIKKKHSDRLKEYKSKVPSFNDVDERLMSIDIDDLGALVQHKRYKWNPTYDERINSLLNGVQSYSEGIVRGELFKQRVVETDLWAEQFSKYLPKDFNDRYAVFTRDRNHIMHNKLIDRAAFKTIKESVEQIEQDLMKAIKRVQNELLSNEEKIEIERQKQIELQMLEDLDHECRENDANVSIRDRYEIEELFQDAIKSFLNAMEENLRFRNDLEIMVHYSETEGNGELFSVKSKIDDVCLNFFYDMQIDDSEGAGSSLDISCDNEEFCTSVRYCNGAVEYDEESGLYMPITEDEIGDVGNTVDEILDLISRELPNYLENAEPEDIAECLTCCECGEEAICINEGILPIGTCMSCGYVNAVYECEMCYSWFNSDEDGRVTNDTAFCQNCLDRMEEE